MTAERGKYKYKAYIDFSLFSKISSTSKPSIRITTCRNLKYILQTNAFKLDFSTKKQQFTRSDS